MTDGAKKVEPQKQRGGDWVQFGDELYRVPALGFRAMRDLQDKIGALTITGGAPTPEQMDVVVEIAHSALTRNYPALTREEVEDMLDIDNFQGVLEAVLRVSLSGRSAPSGEAGASSQ